LVVLTLSQGCHSKKLVDRDGITGIVIRNEFRIAAVFQTADLNAGKEIDDEGAIAKKSSR
jgi:hypothetical protein